MYTGICKSFSRSGHKWSVLNGGVHCASAKLMMGKSENDHLIMNQWVLADHLRLDHQKHTVETNLLSVILKRIVHP